MRVHASSLRLYPPLIAPTGQQSVAQNSPSPSAPPSASEDGEDLSRLAAARTRSSDEISAPQLLSWQRVEASGNVRETIDRTPDPRARKALAAYLQQSSQMDEARFVGLDIYV